MTSSRGLHIPRTALLLSAVVLGLTACGAAQEAVSERIVEQAAGENVDIELGDDGQIASIETEDGSLDIRAGGDVPDTWPADVPLFDGGQITGSYAAASDGESIVTIDYVADGDAEDVVAELTSMYEAAGFSTTAESNMGDGTSGLHQLRRRTGRDDDDVGATYGDGEPTRVILGVVVPAG